MVAGLSRMEMEKVTGSGSSAWLWSSDVAALPEKLPHSPASLKKLPQARRPDMRDPR